MNHIITFLKAFYLLFCLVSPALLFSQPQSEDDANNVTISSKTESYEFIRGNADHPVLIEAQISTTYRCNNFRTSVPFAEDYDDHTSIDEVTIYVNGHLNRKIKPTYSYYPVNDVFYSDARLCYFLLPLEKQNTESRVVVKKTIDDPKYFTTIYFNEMYSVNNKQVLLKVPDWMQLEIKEYNFRPGRIIMTKEKKESATIYTYTIQNMLPEKRSENSPGESYIYPHLLILPHKAQPDEMPPVTYFQTLQDRYDWCRSLIKQVNNDPFSFKMDVEEIVKNKQTDIQKIRAVYQWVQANIRYIAFENGITAFKPESAQEVYRKKYGDCKGMANLLKEMLKVLGYDARLCWLGTNHIAYDHSITSLAADNHMIAAVMINGKFIFLDATEKYLGLGEYAERIQGREVLIEDGDNYILEPVPLVPAMQNTVTGKRLLRIDSGNISGSVLLDFKGESKGYMHFQINRIEKQKRETSLLQFLSGNNNNYKLQDLTLKGLDDWNKNITIEYKLLYNNVVTEFGDEKYITINSRNEFAAMKIDTSRNHDFWLPYKYHFIDTTELILPEGYTIEKLPQPLHIKNDTHVFNLQYTLSGNKIIYTKETMTMNPIIKKEHFTSWNEDISALNSFYKAQIVLKKNKL